MNQIEVRLVPYTFYTIWLQTIVIFGFCKELNMQGPVAKTISIIKDFIFKARIEKAIYNYRYMMPNKKRPLN